LSNKAPTYQQQPYGLNNTILFKGNMVRFSLIKNSVCWFVFICGRI